MNLTRLIYAEKIQHYCSCESLTCRPIGLRGAPAGPTRCAAALEYPSSHQPENPARPWSCFGLIESLRLQHFPLPPFGQVVNIGRSLCAYPRNQTPTSIRVVLALIAFSPSLRGPRSLYFLFGRMECLSNGLTIRIRPVWRVLMIMSLLAASALGMKSVVRVDSQDSIVYLTKFGYLSDGTAKLTFAVRLLGKKIHFFSICFSLFFFLASCSSTLAPRSQTISDSAEPNAWILGCTSTQLDLVR
jgi:hypothetical protein